MAVTCLLSCAMSDRRIQPQAVELKKIGAMAFVGLPGGEFLMGFSDCGLGMIEECPRHRVRVSPFWIGQYEVTQDEFLSVTGRNPSKRKKGGRFPVTNVSWKEASEFCRLFGTRHGVKARLPFEAEWEYACRGNSSSHYYWGDSIDGGYCWFHDNSGASHGKGGPQPVGGKRANAFLLYDMSGNVWEWCADYYDLHYYRDSPAESPRGPMRGELKVLRGGSWNDGAYYMRSGLRNAGGADIGDEFRGFRVVLDEVR